MKKGAIAKTLAKPLPKKFWFNKIANPVPNIIEKINSRRLITLEEGISESGWGKIISAEVYGKIYQELEKPIKNIGAKNAIIPSALEKELEILPSLKKIESEIYHLLDN